MAPEPSNIGELIIAFGALRDRFVDLTGEIGDLRHEMGNVYVRKETFDGELSSLRRQLDGLQGELTDQRSERRQTRMVLFAAILTAAFSLVGQLFDLKVGG